MGDWADCSENNYSIIADNYGGLFIFEENNQSDKLPKIQITPVASAIKEVSKISDWEITWTGVSWNEYEADGSNGENITITHHDSCNFCNGLRD